MTRAMIFRLGLTACSLLLAVLCRAQSGWIPLLNGKDLEGWESVGDGLWTVMQDGTLLGQRDLRRAVHQAWLYTKKEFGEFDLALDYWIRYQGNSGVSIRDSSRAQWAVGQAHDPERTPSHIGYEIQISMGYPDRYPSGSIYLFAQARSGGIVVGARVPLILLSRAETPDTKIHSIALAILTAAAQGRTVSSEP
ncbi:MAG: DUF1080 domain-containing protein [Bryobacteraceae bacterium]|nr:DUF1080 domain-containing protein [Bryobacteraceae bacterium]